MQSFVWQNPVRLIFGIGEVKKAGVEAAKLGKRALLVTGRSFAKRAGWLDQVAAGLRENGVEYVHFDQVEPNPRAATVDRAGGIAREERCDLVIGLGGGSVMDASKGIAAVAISGHPVWEHIYSPNPGGVRKIEGALPIMLIPTVAATSSEGNRGGIITNWGTHQKAGIFSDFLYPRTSIVDPALTVTYGHEGTADGGMDIISHVIESYLTGPDDTPLQDRFSEGIIRTVMENLPMALEHPEDLKARANLSWCSTMALLGPVNLGRPGPYPLHFLEHPLSGHYDIAHGRGLAILFPPLARYTYSARPHKYAQLARNIFFEDISRLTPQAAAIRFIERFEDWMRSVGLYTKLSELGIGSEWFEKIAEDAIAISGFGRDFVQSTQPLHREDIVKILRQAL